MKNYYQILGINNGADIEQIKTAYRKSAQKFHPDKNNGDKYFEERFKEVLEAYEVLSNLVKRKEYDNKLNNMPYEKKDHVKTSSSYTNYQTQNTKHEKEKPKGRNVLPKLSKQTRNIVVVILIILPIIGFIANSFTGLFTILAIYFLLFTFIGTIAEFPNVSVGMFLFGIFGAPTGILFLLYQIFLFATTPTNNTGVTNYSVKQDYELSDSATTVVNSSTTTNFIKDTDSTIEEYSKYKGNQLKNGASPLNICFGKGKFSGQSYITFENSNASDAVVCLVNYQTNETIRNEYIKAGDSYTMRKIPTGVYFLKVYYGNDWNPEKKNFCGINGAFDSNERFSKSDNLGDLIDIKNTNQSYTTGTITLYAVPNGNMSTKNISANEFFK